MKIEKNVAYRTRSGQKAIWEGYICRDGDYRLLVGGGGAKRLYRSDGTHGGYTTRVKKRPELDLVGLWEEPETGESWSIFNNKIQFDLLDEDQQRQLKDWCGEYVYWSQSGNWETPAENGPSWYPINVYRAVPEKEQTVEEQVDDTALKQLWELVGTDNQTEAVVRIKSLIDFRKGAEELLNDLR